VSEEEAPYRPLGQAPGAAPETAPLSLASRLPAAAPHPHKRLALVTGGHRRLGAVIATALAREGFALAIHGSQDTRLDSALALALEEHATPWEGFVADFSDPESAEEMIGAVSLHFGRPPDLLVNGAAIFGQDRLEDVSAADLMRHYAVNCAAPALLTKAFATVPAGGGDRCIVNIVDQRIDHPHGDQFAYTLSKMALAGLTRMTAASLAPRVRVNAVAPGLTIATSDYDDAQMERLAGLMPLDSLPTAEQIAQAVLYLANATATTGQTLYVDGGAHMTSFDRDFMHMAR
jgi:NAD(P)-dependent dehydrogenase (short-subunit alcohol dehydrogenase family)